ncbi:uncharacterized protein [Physcomitrium patens]|uniref:uncharacterized protein n=1 Tax=Physcomitrium patens TaxID=3218 RepID=UPI00024AEA0D|nr:stigma-specific STIG1-like protein 3 [Physcomitrium patens]|eukprot:XP_024400481.1 stigma-specific STIG1-like protein 3 [Physcomitrella patens]
MEKERMWRRRRGSWVLLLLQRGVFAGGGGGGGGLDDQARRRVEGSSGIGKLLLLLWSFHLVASSFPLQLLASGSTTDAAHARNLATPLASPPQRRRVGRFALEARRASTSARRLSAPYVCRWNQEICKQEAIAVLLGPDCCGSVCTDLKNDIFNCGSCGHICFYGSVCCNGDCVDVFSNHRHCGVCHNTCPFGALCQFGLCEYT